MYTYIEELDGQKWEFSSSICYYHIVLSPSPLSGSHSLFPRSIHIASLSSAACMIIIHTSLWNLQSERETVSELHRNLREFVRFDRSEVRTDGIVCTWKQYKVFSPPKPTVFPLAQSHEDPSAILSSSSLCQSDSLPFVLAHVSLVQLYA